MFIIFIFLLHDFVENKVFAVHIVYFVLQDF